MRIHREGYKILSVVLLLLLGLNLALRQFFHTPPIVIILFSLFSLGFFFFVVYFFRSPRRMLFVDETNVIAPADGKIVAIEEVEEGEYFKDKRIQVSIFMSPSNVHVQWTPISGMVKYIKYHPGKYMVAWHPKSSTNNERNTVVIEDDGIEVLVRQIAGLVARRIVHYLDVGDEVEQGHELGFIKFGSRVDVFLPLDAEILVSLKQKVTGKQTILAKLH